MTIAPIPGRNLMIPRTWTRDVLDSTNIASTVATLTVTRQPSLGQATGTPVSVTVDATTIDNTAGTVICRADWVTLDPGTYKFHWTLSGGLVDQFDEYVTVHRSGA